MIRMTRLTDYGIMLLTVFARHPERVRSARELASVARLPQPTVSKILKTLAHDGLLVARRGVKGGFSLSRPPDRISIAEIVVALEGPIAITECSEAHGTCALEPVCIVRSNWRKINRVVLDALEGIALSEMALPLALAPARRVSTESRPRMLALSEPSLRRGESK